MAKQKKIVTTTVTTTTTTTETTGPVREVYDAFVIDRSGSMSSIWNATIDGVNEYLNRSKRTAKETGAKATLSLLWFDDQFITQYDNKPIEEVGVLNYRENPPRGGTALNDAVAKMINRLKEILGDRAGADDVDVTITVFTDGEENMSTEFKGYGNLALKAMIEDVTKRLNWTVAYIGAGRKNYVMDAASSIGIPASNVMNYTADSASTKKLLGEVSAARSVKTANFMAGAKSAYGYFNPDNAPAATDNKTTGTDQTP